MLLGSIARGFLASSLFALLALLTPVEAHATAYDVTWEVDLTTNNFRSGAGGDTVFGIAPHDFTYSVTMRFDDAVAPVLALPAATSTPYGPLAYDFWGYGKDAISGSAGAGSKTWTSANLIHFSAYGDVPASHSWFDIQLADGATSGRSWFRFQDGDGFLILGVGTGVGLSSGVSVYENATGARFDASGMRISVAAVPEPNTALLLSLGLVALAGKNGRLRR